MKLFTIGYEGCTQEQFLAFLEDQGIELIADVRKNPVSRKKGFSKNRLAEGLGTHDIEYMHFPNLGMPKEWRKKAKEKIITRKKMFKDYTEKVLPKQSDDIRLLRKLMKEKKVCLLCFEADASDCHRRNVSDEIKRLDKKARVVDLDVFADGKFQLFSPRQKAASSAKEKRLSS